MVAEKKSQATRWALGILAGCMVSTWPFLLGAAGAGMRMVIDHESRIGYIEKTRFTEDMSEQSLVPIQSKLAGNGERLRSLEKGSARTDEKLNNIERLLREIKEEISSGR